MLVEKCFNAIKKSMTARIIITILLLYFLSLSDQKYITRNIFIILPILLTLFDKVDTIYSERKDKCTKSFEYQLNDKVVDVASYFYTYALFNEDNNILYLSIYRLLGVLLFYFTKTSIWLVVFFDFIKEYMVYTYLFKDNFTYMPLAVIGKFIFEYFFHSIINNTSY
jgi:hypothetical protein